MQPLPLRLLSEASKKRLHQTFFTSFPFYVYNDEYCPDSAVLDSACPYKAVGGECCNVVSMIDGTKDTTLMDHDKYFVSTISLPSGLHSSQDASDIVAGRRCGTCTRSWGIS